jgi:hypothetical protein
MTVEQLIEELKRVPLSATIVVRGSDHSYRTASVSQGYAELDREDGSLSELEDEIPVSCRVPILLIQ